MTPSRIGRVLVTLASALFTVVALAFWAAPEGAAQYLGLAAIRPDGIGALRTELGGLFAGLALLCGWAAWTTERTAAFGGAAVLAAVVISRGIGWLGNPAVGLDLPALAVELTVMAALLGVARGSSTVRAQRSRASWRPLVALAVLLPAAGGALLVNPGLQLRAFSAAAERMASTVNRAPLEDDALRVAICGSSAPLPS